MKTYNTYSCPWSLGTAD